MEAAVRKRIAAALAIAVAAAVAMQACAPQPKKVRIVRRVIVRRPAPPPPVTYPAYVPWGEHTIDSRMAEIGPRARQRWQHYFREAGVSYPAGSVMLVAFKRERRLEVYAGPSPYGLSFIRSLDVTAASGGPGPKLREGDKQVPEGIYEIDKLNPNSLYHVSMRLAYPNEFDRRMAERDRRRKLGGAIMIHGGAKSIGCLAVGDEAAEDLFALAADAGKYSVSVMILPRDFRRTGETELLPGQPPWVRELYASLDVKLRSLPQPAAPVTAHDPAPPLDLTSR